MKKKRLMSLILSCILIITFFNPALAQESENNDTSHSINLNEVNSISISKEQINNLPNQIKLFLTENSDTRLLDSIIYHYRVTENNGEVSKELVRTFEITDYKDFEEFSIYRESNSWNPPRKGRDIFVGISAYGINSSYPTAYQIQGWWEWDRGALGVYHSNWDVIGLTFYGYTSGYDYNCYANGVNTGVTLYPVLKDSTDNGVAFQHTSETLSEGTVLAKVDSPYSNSDERFEVKFTYEHFSQNPNSSYLRDIILNIIGIKVWLPTLPPGDERFDPEIILSYGNN